MGSVIVDILMLCVVGAFVWSGAVLRFRPSLSRTLRVLAALIAAALMRAPVSAFISWLTPFSEDLSSLIALIVMGIGMYSASGIMVAWIRAWRAPIEEEEDEMLAGIPAAEPYTNPYLGAAPGLVLGLTWAMLLTSMLILVPAWTTLPAAAISSRSGAFMLTGGEPIVRWLNQSFPRYTQTLPKGKTGAQLVGASQIPISGDSGPQVDPDAAGLLFSAVNRWRLASGKLPFTWSPEIASAAQRHSKLMVTERFLGVRERNRDTPDSPGVSFTQRMQAAMGVNASRFDSFDAFVVWAHSPDHAVAAVVRNPRARRLLSQKDTIEVGVGMADAGWFNGEMYTVGLAGKRGRAARVAAVSDTNNVTSTNQTSVRRNE